MKIVIRGRKLAVWALLLSGLVVCLLTATLAANYISGSARNQTEDKPAAGDEVVLLRLQDMQEEARTKTDARGMFAFQIQNPHKQYLVRVIHQGVNYDQIAFSGSALSLSVFDTSPKVDRIAGNIEILRAGTNGNLLHVSDMLEIENRSSPPITRAGPRTLDVYLPANARVDSVLAAGPAKIAVAISATPMQGEPGHYTVDFPLQPGATKFAFNYDVPYEGHAVFQTRHAYGLQQLAVMISPTMRFASSSSAFELLATGNRDYQAYATKQLRAGEAPRFEITGTGVLPTLAGRAQVPRGTPAAEPLRRADVNSSRVALLSLPRAVLPSQSAPRAWQWTVLGAMGAFVMCVVLLLIWRSSKLRNFGGTKATMARGTPLEQWRLLLDLKKELSKLEEDLNRGLITRREFDATSHALLQALERAVARVH